MGILDLFKLDGKVGLVTGAGQGIGRAYALALAEAGADVAVVDINDKTGRSVADEIASLGRGALYVRADVSKPEEIEAMVAATEARFGGLDIAVNNAWAGGRFITPPPPEEFPLDAWDFTMSLLLRAAFVGCQVEARAMRKRGRGKIINAASISSYVANTGVAYSTAKAGVVMLTRCLAAAWGKFNVNVNCISPSYTLSPARRTDSRADRDYMRSLHPAGWYERPEDLAGTLVYLASDASNYVTGREIVVDGGHTLNVWLKPLEREFPPLVSPRDEAAALNHDLDLLGIPHDEDGLLLD
ncbi:MAG: SDR family oxidoreductase [Chloroflexi bacterium]|nr:SDR family oxidoreductase [Chloroflexota bacterium]